MVKGSALIPGHKYLLKHYGEAGMGKVLAKMDTAHATLMKEKLLASKWYPYQMFVSLLRATDDIFGRGDNTFLMDLGSLSAKEGLSSFYKFFIRAGKPKATLERLGKVWSSYFDFGTMSLQKSEEGHAVLKLTDWSDPRKEFCWASMGWLKGAIELAGGQNVRVVETRCSCLGDKYCEFEIKWE